MGGGGSTQTTTQESEPWEVLQPYLKDVYSQAQSQFRGPAPQYYSGQTIAGFTPAQLQAQQNIQNFATTGASQVLNPALSAYQYGTGSSILDVARNPYVQGMAQGAVSDVMSQLTPQMADIRSGAIMSGGYGGSRQGIAEGMALAGAADAATRAAADIYGQAYGQGLDTQTSTLGMTGDMLRAGLMPSSALAASGAEQQALQQQQLLADKAKFDYEQNKAAGQLAQYQSLLSGTAGLVGNAGTTTTTQPGQSTIGQLGQLGMLGVSLFNPTYGMGLAMPGSDIRLKKNIKKIGKTNSGINIYKWEWKDIAYKLNANLDRTVGVLAQEIKDIIPEAVIKAPDGYYRVNYSMIEGV